MAIPCSTVCVFGRSVFGFSVKGNWVFVDWRFGSKYCELLSDHGRIDGSAERFVYRSYQTNLIMIIIVCEIYGFYSKLYIYRCTSNVCENIHQYFFEHFAKAAKRAYSLICLVLILLFTRKRYCPIQVSRAK